MFTHCDGGAQALLSQQGRSECVCECVCVCVCVCLRTVMVVRRPFSLNRAAVSVCVSVCACVCV